MSRFALSPGGGAAFRSRPFRLYWSAQVVSMMGTFMQLVALGYLVYDLTGSKWLLGAISALQMGPSLLLSLPAGVVADRVQRKHLILLTQSSALILAFSLATLTALHRLEVWEILVISTLSGIAIALESPARQAFVSNLVGRPELSNAIAWNSLAINGSRVLGPAVGGVAIRYLGVAPIFYFNSFSFLAVIVALIAMRLPSSPRMTQQPPLLQLREGLSYLRQAPAIKLILGLLAVIATFVMNYSVLMPVLARDALHTGPEGLGWMWAGMGLGAVAGSLTVVVWSRSAIQGALLLSSALAACISTIALAAVQALLVAVALLLVVGWSTGAFFAGANAAIQHRVDDRLRGRVLSVYAMIFAGSGPIGGILVAGLASVGGVRLSLLVSGLAGIALTLAIAPLVTRRLNDAERRPEVAVAAEAVSG
jgi:MFS family permease